MTRRSNARVAGITFLVYIVAGLSSMALFGRFAGGEGAAERLATMAGHASGMRLLAVLGMVQSLCALVLAVTLWAVTRDEDADVAMLGLVSRVVEGVMVGLSVFGTLALIGLATATGVNAPEPGAARVLASYLLRSDMAVSATFFAVGSTAFAWLLRRGRMIPGSLAWLGLAASVLLVVVLPLQIGGVVRGMVASLVWLPMLVFEVWLALWFIVKGVGPGSATARPAP